jgi:hypothetical protein
MAVISKAIDRINLGNLVTTAVQVFSVLAKQSFSMQVQLDVNTPSAVVFASATDVNTTTDAFTETAHGYTTGVLGQFTTSVALPAGLAAVTDYYAIVVDANTFKFATSLANALAGTAINITTTGTGNQTFTPTALAGGFIKLQKSNVPAVLAAAYTYSAADWTDVAAATAVTVDATFWAEVSTPAYLATCIHTTLTAGRIGTVINYASRFRDSL